MAWRRTPLSCALRQVKDVIRLEDKKKYRQVTVSLHGRGLRLRRIVSGKDVKTKRQYRVRTGQFLYSRIDARNGAFGLVPSELNDAIVSNDFPVFDVDPNVAEAEFIAYLAQSEWFVSQCKDPSRGVTNRRRMAEDQLLALEISLPPLEDQRRIVNTIEAVTARLADVRRLRESIDAEHDELLHAFARELATKVLRRPLQDVAPVIRRPVVIDKEAMYSELGVRSFGRGTFHKSAISGATLGRKRVFESPRDSRRPL